MIFDLVIIIVLLIVMFLGYRLLRYPKPKVKELIPTIKISEDETKALKELVSNKPIKDSPIRLNEGERAILRLDNIDLLEYKNIKTKGMYQGISLRVIDGLSYRVGEFSAKQKEALAFKKEIGAFTNMKQWDFIGGSNEEIQNFFSSFNSGERLSNFFSTKAFIIDKNGDLRGRNTDEDYLNGMLYGYNMKSVSELNAKLKDDVKVLYYEYYAAFKEKNINKADRKEVGLWEKNILM